jgi:acyl carrier protein
MTQAFIEKQVMRTIADLALRDTEEVNASDTLSDDLGFDSLDRTELTMTLEENFLDDHRIPEEIADGWKKVSDVVKTITSMLEE